MDKQRGLLLQWASPSATAHAPWTGKLRDAPPGLVMKTVYAGGASSFYLLDRQNCATGSGNATTVRVTLMLDAARAGESDSGEESDGDSDSGSDEAYSEVGSGSEHGPEGCRVVGSAAPY